MGVWNAGPAPTTAPLRVDVADPDGRVVATFEAQEAQAQTGASFWTASVDVAAPLVWSREAPAHRYTATATVGSASASDEFGFRTVAVADGDILLNGERIFLHGISRHEDHPTLGPVQTPELMQADLALLRELGVDHIRPGHYTAHPGWVRRLGAAGITVTEEIPVYQLDPFQLADKDLLENARRQLIEMIERDRNEPAIILWSMGNEVWQFFPQGGTFFRSLAQTLHEYDDTRLTTYAALTIPYFMGVLPDSITPSVDVVSANEYYGWYYPFAFLTGSMLDAYQRRFPDKPFVVSEFGADALGGQRLGRPPFEELANAHSYSEDFQAWLLQTQFDQILARDYVDGTMPWVFADFRMQWVAFTKPHPVPETNLKGLLTGERDKKLAFDTVARIYDDAG